MQTYIKLAVVVTVGILLSVTMYLSSRLSATQEELAQLRLTHMDTVQTLEKVIETNARAIQVMKNTIQETGKRLKHTTTTLEGVRHAKDTDDGPLAPVLNNLLDGLRVQD